MKRAALLTPTAAVVASALWHLPHVRHFSAASHLGLKHHRHYSSRSQVHTPFSAQTLKWPVNNHWPSGGGKRGRGLARLFVFLHDMLYISSDFLSLEKNIMEFLTEFSMMQWQYISKLFHFKFHVHKLDEKDENVPFSLEHWYKWSTDLLNIPPTFMD